MFFTTFCWPASPALEWRSSLLPDHPIRTGYIAYSSRIASEDHGL